MHTVLLDELNSVTWWYLEIYRTEHKDFNCFSWSHNSLRILIIYGGTTCAYLLELCALAHANPASSLSCLSTFNYHAAFFF
jgi:hypothetical protein